MSQILILFEKLQQYLAGRQGNGWKAGRYVSRQADRQAGRQAYRQAGRHVGRQASRQVGRQICIFSRFKHRAPIQKLRIQFCNNHLIIVKFFTRKKYNGGLFQ
jgi:hypothetical protein